jgi:IS5 family transposase
MKDSTYQRDFFSEQRRLEYLNSLGNKLNSLERYIDFEMFRSDLEQVFPVRREGEAGRPPFDAVLMFKVLIIQRLHGLSDDQTEFQINDRITFMKFLGLNIDSKFPDSKTIWSYRERLIKGNVMESLFERFTKHLHSKGVIAKTGILVDSTIVEVPIQRVSKEESKEIKIGNPPETRKDNPNSMAQTDMDARWTSKSDKDFYGYKNHVAVDAESKIIVAYSVTDASVNDSQVLGELVEDVREGTKVWADKGYYGEPSEKVLEAKGLVPSILEKATRGNPLTEAQKTLNNIKSRIRARVEHVFGYAENSLSGYRTELIGLERTSLAIGLENLLYNMFRLIFLKKSEI